MTAMLEAALQYCRAGYSVVAIRGRSKTPREKQWQKKQMSEQDILDHWSAFPDDNIALHPGHSDLFVVDGDTMKEGGGEDLITFLNDTQLNVYDGDVPRAISANGGTHYFFRFPGGIGNKKVCSTIDIKSVNGCILVWPSVLPASEAEGWRGGQYKWATDNIVDFPSIHTVDAAVVEKIGGRFPNLQNTEAVTSGSINNTYKTDNYELITGKISDGREDLMFKTVWQHGKFLLRDGFADLPETLWVDRAWKDFSTLAQPYVPGKKPRTREHIIEKVQSILTNPQKVKELREEFLKGNLSKQPQVVSEELVAEVGNDNIKAFDIEPWDFVDDVANTAAEYVEGLLTQGVSVWYGPSNVGKTFIVFDLAAHIAWGRPWNGLEVEQGRAVYIAAEGVGGLRKRRMAFKKHYPDVPANIPLDIINDTPDLVQGIDTLRLIETIGEAKLVILDTLAACSAGAQENDSAVMTAITGNARAISEKTGAHVILVHHSGKASESARGHSSLRGAIDTEVHITSAQANQGKIKVTKQRDLEFLPPWVFELKTVDLGENQRGKNVTSCVVEFTGAKVEAELTSDEFQLEKIINNLISGRPAKPIYMQFSGGTKVCRDHLTRDELFVQFSRLASMGGVTEKTIKNKFSKAILGLGRKILDKNLSNNGRPKYVIDNKSLGIP